jgi:probable phosphoglycerate mutase
MDALLRLPGPGATELLLIRHAEPSGGQNGRQQARLSDRGLRQAERLARRLEATPIEAIYASTTGTALETARRIASGRSLAVIQVPELRELALHPAALNGSAHDIEGLQAEVYRRFIDQPRWDSLNGIEGTRQFRHRTVQALEAIVSRHPAGCITVVTHQPAINAYLSMILGIERDMFFQPEFTSISRVRIREDLYAVQAMNDYAHLTPQCRSE